MWNIAQPLYKLEDAPLNPARAASDLVAALGPDGVVCAEAGRAGWWVARTVPTTRLGSVQVPAAPTPGLALERALAVARTGVPAAAVVDAPMTEALTAQVKRANDENLPLIIEVWGDPAEGVGCEYLEAYRHRQLLEQALRLGVAILVAPAIDFSPTADLVAACGPLVAWT